MAKQRMFPDAEITRVVGPDMFEARVNLGFDIDHTRRLRLLGVDSEHVRSLTQDSVRKAMEFLRDRIEGQLVTLKVQRKGEHYYARVCYGSHETDILDEMANHGLLKKFDRNNGDGL